MDFSVSAYYLGTTKARFSERSSSKAGSELSRSNEENVIDQVENAQLDGLIPMDGKGLSEVDLRISKYGARIVDQDMITLDRIPLVNIVFTVAYDDGFERSNFVMVTKARHCEPEYRCHVFQCNSMRDADEFLKKIRQLFDSVIETVDRSRAEQEDWVDV
ncbi:unnamed protein product [Nippostrongylus brasiliensis]|uniref:PID domain-containing protein n=1 Tax=Nippostrongylus brasiliensis TaxID=27835 RepID=A0A0N4Y639_NIPBR|nr:unnamed protein product [Nippostrongylus brasiliensis]